MCCLFFLAMVSLFLLLFRYVPGVWKEEYTVVIPRCRLSAYGTRAFSVAGPVCWNSLPDYLKSSDLSFNCFRQQLKHFYFANIDTSPSTTLAH